MRTVPKKEVVRCECGQEKTEKVQWPIACRNGADFAGSFAAVTAIDFGLCSTATGQQCIAEGARRGNREYRCTDQGRRLYVAASLDSDRLTITFTDEHQEEIPGIGL